MTHEKKAKLLPTNRHGVFGTTYVKRKIDITDHDESSGAAKRAKVITKDTVYCDPQANVQLLSSDHVEFWVHDYYLMAASSVFRDMFEQAKPTPDHPIPMEESAATLRSLLNLICRAEAATRISQSAPPGSRGTGLLFKAMDKYDYQQGTDMLTEDWRAAFKSGRRSQKAFALACEFNMEPLARVALEAFAGRSEAAQAALTPWAQGGGQMCGRLATGASASYMRACMEAAHVKPPKAYTRNSIDTLWVVNYGVVDWKKAAANFRL